MVDLKKRRQPFAMTTVVRAEKPTSAKPGDKAIIAPDGTLTGWIGGSCAQDIVVRNALESLEEGTPRFLNSQQHVHRHETARRHRRSDAVLQWRRARYIHRTQPAAAQPAEAIDPICNMTVEIAMARFVSEYQGQKYYFCCAHCQRTFEKSHVA